MAFEERCCILVGAALYGSSGGFEGWAGLNARQTRASTCKHAQRGSFVLELCMENIVHEWPISSTLLLMYTAGQLLVVETIAPGG